MKKQALHITLSDSNAEGLTRLTGDERVAVSLALSFVISVFVALAVSFSPVAELIIGIGIITVLPILQVLISGIINLNLIIR